MGGACFGEVESGVGGEGRDELVGRLDLVGELLGTVAFLLEEGGDPARMMRERVTCGGWLCSCRRRNPAMSERPPALRSGSRTH